MKAYRIDRWPDIYENNKSREVETLSYYLQPNKLVGEGIGYLLMLPDGLEIYGVFGFLKSLASTTSPPKLRGWLYRNGSPLTPERIEMLTRIPKEKIVRALDVLASAPVNWMVHEEMPDTTATPRGQAGDTTATPGRQAKDTISPGLRTDKGLTELKKESKKAASLEEARLQSRQFSAKQALLADLEAVPDDDRTAGQRAELKKMRAELQALRKKQAAGDFTLTEEAAAA